ncbi:hypothetical protein CP_0443 [Chlamydia pneumoniae AR39]|uniref:Uncharacterized protein n=1 Tax=Chlamydia pneumoniae TaxID=83558 RepID=Q9K267_CHLPN|nr:hypothetical protein CP_0443 [Chlamydia pneumoniae AR39]
MRQFLYAKNLLLNSFCLVLIYTDLRLKFQISRSSSSSNNTYISVINL